MERQREIDFSHRPTQHNIRREAVLPSVVTTDGGAVKPVVLKAVLAVLDDHGRGAECFLKFSTIASEAGISLRQAKRAIEALQSLSLVCVETRCTSARVRCNHYRIVWSELAVRCPSRQRSDLPAGPLFRAPDREATPGEQSASSADQSASPEKQSAIPGDQSASLKGQSAILGTFIGSAKERSKEPPPPKRFRAAADFCADDFRAYELGDETGAASSSGSMLATARCREQSAIAVWTALERELVQTALRGCGLGRWAAFSREAEARGLTPSEIATVCAEFAGNRRKFTSPGAIVDRLRSGAWCVEGVLSAAAIAAQQAQAAQRLAAIADERRERHERAQQSAREEADWERVLSALPAEELDELAARAIPAFYRSTWRQERLASGVCRLALINALAKEEAQ